MSHDMPMTPGSMSGGNMSNCSMDMMPMHMSFYWGKEAIILFPGWPKDSLGMYILAFLFVLFIAVAVEILTTSSTSRLRGNNNNPIVAAFTEACGYAIRMGLAYMVMLAVMSFNVGIFIAAVAGHAIGFFIVKARALAAVNQAHHDGISPKV